MKVKPCEGAARRGGTARRQEDLAFVLIDHHRIGGRESASVINTLNMFRRP